MKSKRFSSSKKGLFSRQVLISLAGVLFFFFMVSDSKYGFSYHASYINSDINKELWHQYGDLLTSLEIKEIRSPDPMSFFTDIEVDFINDGKLITISLEVEDRKSLKVSWLNIHSHFLEHRGPTPTARGGYVSPSQKHKYTLDYNKYLLSRATFEVSKYKNVKYQKVSIPTLSSKNKVPKHQQVSTPSSNNPYDIIKQIQCLNMDVIDINCEMKKL